MRFLVRLIISLAGGVTALAMLLVFLTFLVSEYGASPPQRGPGSTDAWLGRWIGPEGTFLLLEGGNGRYEVTIQNLDGARVFQGRAAGARIEFERDGSAETLHATNGADTGMKWLADKTNCLTVRVGEGYCRD
jgi:hypothetical protein